MHCELSIRSSNSLKVFEQDIYEDYEIALHAVNPSFTGGGGGGAGRRAWKIRNQY